MGSRGWNRGGGDWRGRGNGNAGFPGGFSTPPDVQRQLDAAAAAVQAAQQCAAAAVQAAQQSAANADQERLVALQDAARADQALQTA